MLCKLLLAAGMDGWMDARFFWIKKRPSVVLILDLSQCYPESDVSPHPGTRKESAGTQIKE